MSERPITILFGEFALIQHSVRLEKKKEYSFIEMADVEPYTKYVIPKNTRIWNGSGGAKFHNDDTIFARIAPCLEHGKIAKVSQLIKTMGFGSTEFFVFRAKEGISDPDFLYYLARSSIIMEPAIKSMIGSSGRQRVQRNAIENILVPHIPLHVQKKIADILSAYDDLIENNRRRIALLEQAARLLYREWFVHLRFPGHEHTPIIDGIPQGWEKKKYKDLFNFLNGYPFKSTTYQTHGRFGIVTIRNVHDAHFIPDCSSFLDFVPNNMKPHCFLSTGDILLSLTGNVGRACIVYGDGFLLNQRVVKIVGEASIPRSFVYWTFSNEASQLMLEKLAYGVAQLNLSSILLR